MKSLITYIQKGSDMPFSERVKTRKTKQQQQRNAEIAVKLPFASFSLLTLQQPQILLYPESSPLPWSNEFICVLLTNIPKPRSSRIPSSSPGCPLPLSQTMRNGQPHFIVCKVVSHTLFHLAFTAARRGSGMAKL